MIDLAKLQDSRVLSDLRHMEKSDEEIHAASVEFLFEEFLIWNGIIGYSSCIIEALDTLRAAEDNSLTFKHNMTEGTDF